MAGVSEVTHKPFAVAPLKRAIAREASSGVSYVTIATPEERPLRSYFKGERNANRGRQGLSWDLFIRMASYPDQRLAYKRADVTKHRLKHRVSNTR